MQNFMFLAFGLGALIVALALTLVLLRLNRTLFVIDALVETATDEMRETLPEVRESLSNVNEITSGVNVALQSAGSGFGQLNSRLKETLRERALDIAAAWYGVQVASRSLASAQMLDSVNPSGRSEQVEASEQPETLASARLARDDEEGNGDG